MTKREETFYKLPPISPPAGGWIPKKKSIFSSFCFCPASLLIPPILSSYSFWMINWRKLCRLDCVYRRSGHLYQGSSIIISRGILNLIHCFCSWFPVRKFGLLFSDLSDFCFLCKILMHTLLEGRLTPFSTLSKFSGNCFKRPFASGT